MPGYDRTGPDGNGPQTGRGFGPCGDRNYSGRGRGRGMGQVRGQGTGRGYGRRNQSYEGFEDIKESLESIGKRLDKIEKK